MKRHMALPIKSSLLKSLLLLFLPLLLYGGEFTKKDLQKLKNGKFIAERITDNSGCKGLQLQFTIAASRERIWEVLADNSMLDKLSKDLDKMEILEETTDSAQVSFWVTVLFKQYNYILQRNFEKEQYRITWHRVRGDFKIIKGSWEIHLFPRGPAGTSLVIYTSFLDTGYPIPPFIADVIMKVKTKDLVRRLRNLTESKD